MSDLDLNAIRASIDKAEALVGELAAGDQRWKMTIPVDMDRDSDMILTAALTSAKLLIVEVEHLTAERDSLRVAVDRDEAEVNQLDAEVERLNAELEAQRRDHGRDLWRAAQQLTKGGDLR